MKDSFVVITMGGTQHIVAEGDEIVINRVQGKVGDTVTIDSVHLYQDDKNTQIGSPSLPYTVKAEIIDQFKGEKMHVRTYKAKSRYRRKKGHRQSLTRLKIAKITKKRASSSASNTAKKTTKPKRTRTSSSKKESK